MTAVLDAAAAGTANEGSPVAPKVDLQRGLMTERGPLVAVAAPSEELSSISVPQYHLTKG